MENHQGFTPPLYPPSSRYRFPTTYPVCTYTPATSWTKQQQHHHHLPFVSEDRSLPSAYNPYMTSNHNVPSQPQRDLPRRRRKEEEDQYQQHVTPVLSERQSHDTEAAASSKRVAYPQASKEDMDYLFNLCCSDEWSDVLRMIMKSPWFATTPIVMGNNIVTTVLHQAITKRSAQSMDRIKVIKSILHNAPQAASLRNGYGSLPLHAICQRNIRIDSQQKENLIRAFIRAYPGSVAEPGGVGKRTPLHIIFTDYYSAALTYEMIEAAPMACSMADKKGYLPAHVACSRHCSPEKLLMLLHVYPQALYETTNDGHTLLSLAETTSTTSHPNHSLIEEIKKQLIEHEHHRHHHGRNNNDAATRIHYEDGNIEMPLITESDKSCSTESCSRTDETPIVTASRSHDGRSGTHYYRDFFDFPPQPIPNSSRLVTSTSSRNMIPGFYHDYPNQESMMMYDPRRYAKPSSLHPPHRRKQVTAKKGMNRHYPPRLYYTEYRRRPSTPYGTCTRVGTRGSGRSGSSPVDLLLHFSRATESSQQVTDGCDALEGNGSHHLVEFPIIMETDRMPSQILFPDDANSKAANSDDVGNDINDMTTDKIVEV